MFQNYLKITFRTLVKQRAHSLINIAGLAIGLACCLLIVLFVLDEISYDRHHEHADRIYRMVNHIKFGGTDANFAVSPSILAPTLIKDFPEVAAAARLRDPGNYLVKKEGGDQSFKEWRLVFADNSIFDIFTIPMIAGDPATALNAPNTAVISRSMAEKYFGANPAYGQTIILDNKEPYKVTGVVEDMPNNSHFNFDFFLAMEGLEESKQGSWLSNNFQTYVLLNDPQSAPAFSAKLPALVERYAYPQAAQILNTPIAELLESDNKIEFFIQPLTDIHLHSNLIAELQPNSDIKYVYIFSAIALFILLIACINFMNLSTARSAKRAREVGMRKVLGSGRRQLIGQFLAESVLISLVAMVVAMGLVELLLPSFNQLADKSLATLYFDDWRFLTGLIIAAVIIGIFAGSYPAFFLSGFRPIAVLKGKLSLGSGSGTLRSVLVVFQFAASIFLIVSTFVVYSQLRFIQNKNLGFNKEQVLLLRDAYALGDQLESFKAEVMRHPDVQMASTSSYLPVHSSRSNTGFWPRGPMDQEKAVSMQIWTVDHDYAKTMQLEFIDGRDFSIDFTTDSSAIILNERAAGMFAFDKPVGNHVSTFAYIPGKGVIADSMEHFQIIGVVKNFHFESMTDNIGPLGLRIGRSAGKMSVRFNVSDVSGLIAFMQERWQAFAPGQPFDYSFLDDQFSSMYQSETQVGQVFAIFAGLAIFIACLGLFGLAAYTAEQRTKEIGVRKVLGASIPSIVGLFSKEFLILIAVAFVIASPLAFWVMNGWLQDFVYRTDIGVLIFLGAGMLVAAIALLTVGYQALKAALTNPVEALNYE